MSARAPVVLALALAGCALAEQSETLEGQPIFVLGNPVCLFGCAADVGNVRSEGGGSPSLSQAASAGAQGVAP